jgi:HD-GYP domain-containing protein (c-di-GMP phosphodiesterase class II)
MIVRKVKVAHSGILLHDFQRDTYVLTVSGGQTGLRIPKGFARMDADNPLIRFFRNRTDKKIFSEGLIVYEQAKNALKRKGLNDETREILNGALYQMEIFGAAACMASYFRDDLLGILLLGEKLNKKKFGRDELEFFVALGHDVAMAIKNAQLFKELETELKQKQQLFINTTVALAAAIDAKDHYTHGHTERVTNLSLAIAKKLAEINKKEFNDGFLEHLHIASLLHDIGKIGIPESVLNKDGALNDEEKKLIMDHPDIGAVILNPIRELEECIQGVKYHHENYDGSGYPEGLKGEQIPLIASIISVADTFDAMTTDRPYRKGLSKEEAVREIERVAGQQLNPEICGVFVQLYKEGKF